MLSAAARVSNSFAYVESNPLLNIDPEGLAPKKYEKEPNPNKKPPPPHRIPSGERERSIGHPDAEEHGRRAKGQRGTRGSRGASGFAPFFIWDVIHEVCDKNPYAPECAVVNPPKDPENFCVGAP